MGKVLKIFVGFILLIVVISAFASTSPTSKNNDIAKESKGGVTTGLGSKDATGDVTLGAYTPDDFGGSVAVTIKNNSEKRSNYSIDLSAESEDGKIQYGTSSVYVSNLDPGMTTIEKGQFFDKLEPGAIIKAKTIQRTEAV